MMITKEAKEVRLSYRSKARNTLAFIFLLTMLIGILLGIVSVLTSFQYWPWTVTNNYRTGTHFGFSIGMSVDDAIGRTIALQETRELGQLKIFERGKTNDEEYRRNPVQRADRDFLVEQSHWNVDVLACNCWLLLDFENGKLREISHKYYRGPQK